MGAKQRRRREAGQEAEKSSRGVERRTEAGGKARIEAEGGQDGEGGKRKVSNSSRAPVHALDLYGSAKVVGRKIELSCRNRLRWLNADSQQREHEQM